MPTPPTAASALDPHSYAQGQALRHLHLALTVDFDRRELAGSAIWLLAEPLAAPIILVLDTHNLTIEGVHVGDKASATPVPYSLAAPDPVLGQALRLELPASAAAVHITYRTSPGAAALQWLAPAQTAGEYPFLFTQSQAILARTWLPCPDSPGQRFSYEAEVEIVGSARGHLLALMSAADNPQATAPDGRYRFRQPQPVPAYLLALAVGRLDFAPLGEHTGLYAEPATLARATYEFGELERMVAAAEQLYGPYR